MKLLLWSCLFFVLISKFVKGHLLSPRNVCSQKNTCSSAYSANGCRCDDACSFFNDCCFDAPAANAQRRNFSGITFSCLTLPRSVDSIYVVDKCLKSWTGDPELRRKCENDDFSDPLMSVPTTDVMYMNITYRNRYCAECNWANPYYLSSWNPTLVCDSLRHVALQFRNITQDFILENLIRAGDSWGVYHWDISRGGVSFFPCTISFSLPESLKNHVRPCDPHMVTSCAAAWSEEILRRRCSDSYKGTVFDASGNTFRNMHCAVCNYVSLYDIRCFPPAVGGYGGSSGLVNWVFPMDLSKTSCLADQWYDSFFKKCRTLLCTQAGYVSVNGQCVRRWN